MLPAPTSSVLDAAAALAVRETMEGGRSAVGLVGRWSWLHVRSSSSARLWAAMPRPATRAVIVLTVQGGASSALRPTPHGLLASGGTAFSQGWCRPPLAANAHCAAPTCDAAARASGEPFCVAGGAELRLTCRIASTRVRRLAASFRYRAPRGDRCGAFCNGAFLADMRPAPRWLPSPPVPRLPAHASGAVLLE